MRAGVTHLPIAIAAMIVCISFANRALGDNVLYRYEGDVLPDDPSAGWLVIDLCEDLCSSSLEDGRFVLRWPRPADFAYYHLWIARANEPAPESLWVEWRFRSNHPLGPSHISCDARLSIVFQTLVDVMFMYGTAVISHSGSDFLTSLQLNEMHTYRFESPNGADYSFSVNGRTVWSSRGIGTWGLTYIQFGGDGGCETDWVPNMVNEWDFIRYGTISAGEQLETAVPPSGVLDARQHAGIDRILTVFQEPNYVYADEITIEATDLVGFDGPSTPVATPLLSMTRRREPPDPMDVEDDPRVVEIVLDRPLPYNATTLITLDDGAVVNTIEYTFAPGDANGTGGVDLWDVAYLQNCVGTNDTGGLCGVFDFDRNGALEAWEFLFEVSLTATPTANASRRHQEN